MTLRIACCSRVDDLKCTAKRVVVQDNVADVDSVACRENVVNADEDTVAHGEDTIVIDAVGRCCCCH